MLARAGISSTPFGERPCDTTCRLDLPGVRRAKSNEVARFILEAIPGLSASQLLNAASPRDVSPSDMAAVSVRFYGGSKAWAASKSCRHPSARCAQLPRR